MQLVQFSLSIYIHSNLKKGTFLINKIKRKVACSRKLSGAKPPRISLPEGLAERAPTPGPEENGISLKKNLKEEKLVLPPLVSLHSSLCFQIGKTANEKQIWIIDLLSLIDWNIFTSECLRIPLLEKWVIGNSFWLHSGISSFFLLLLSRRGFQ